MNDFSLYEIINTKPLDEEELAHRYDDYLNKEIDNSVDNVVLNYLKSAFESMINRDDDIFLSLLDEKADLYDETALAAFLGEDYIITLLKSQSLHEKLIKMLCEGKTFSRVYFAIFIINLCPDCKNEELDNILKTFIHNFYFAQHILPIYKDDKDYLRLVHEAHYSLLSDNAIGSTDFYFTYPKVEKTIFNSLDTMKNSLIDINGTLIEFVIENFDNFTKEDELLALMQKHDTSLYYYDEVVDLIDDFDAFFKDEHNIKACLEVANKELCDNFNKYPYCFNFIMTLLTRCYQKGTFEFALGMLTIIKGNYANRRYYDFLDQCIHINSFSHYAFDALSVHPKYQKELYRLAEDEDASVANEALARLDIKIKKNLNLVKRAYRQNFISPDTSLMIASQLNLKEMVSDPLLNKKDVEFVEELLYSLVLIIIKPLIFELDDYHDIVIMFYQNFVNTHFVEAHQLSVNLLMIFEGDKNYDKEIVDTILSGIVYEDEIDYIDSVISKKGASLDSAFLMMKYYNYYPLDKIRTLVKKKPLLYVPIVSFMYLGSNEKEVHDYTFEYLELINKKLPNIIKKEKNEDNYELSFCLCALAKLVEDVGKYYPQIFYCGLAYPDEMVQGTFIKALDVVKKNDLVDDENLDLLLDNILKSTKDQILVDMIKNIKDNRITS